ncbi:transposase IS4 family protein [groundwater metagenome]
MFNINLCLQCLKTCLNSKTLSQLIIIVTALLSMTGRVTMLGISRWTGEGGSYRTVQRFFNTSIDWKNVQWSLIQKFFLNTSDTFVLAGDETTVTKAGKKTFGLDRFFFIPIWENSSRIIILCIFSGQYKMANLTAGNGPTDDSSKRRNRN